MNIKGGIRLSLAYWTSLYSLSNFHVCGLFVKRNNKDGIDGIIIPLGMHYYLSVALHCNSRTGKRRPNYSRNVKCICKLTNLLRLGTPISKLSKELYVQFFLEKAWIVPAAIARKLEASSIITFSKKSENVRRKFYEKRYILYLARFYP